MNSRTLTQHFNTIIVNRMCGIVKPVIHTEPKVEFDIINFILYIYSCILVDFIYMMNNFFNRTSDIIISNFQQIGNFSFPTYW